MKLSDHFSIEEFTTSSHRSINNQIPSDLIPNAIKTCEMLERIRDHLSNVYGSPVPIIISSGYRSLELNIAVGGQVHSDHVKALAVDWIAPTFGSAFAVCSALAPNVGVLGIGQLIHEYGRWIHTGTNMPSKMINRIITISKNGISVGVAKV